MFIQYFKKNITVCFLIFLPIISFSQYGADNSFSSINIEASTCSESMGGNVISIINEDLNIAQIAPSLLNVKSNNKIVFSVVDYFADISLLGFAYAKEYKNLGIFSIGVRSIDYGDFEYNDESGNNLGQFEASDQIITFGGSKRITKKLIFGTNFNFFNSQYESYTSTAIYSNISLTYDNNTFVSTLLCKNLGRQLDPYTNKRENLPLNIQFSLSKQLKYLPFRYVITYNYLNQFDISSPYKLNYQTNFETGELETIEESVAKKILRHFIIGGELNPFKKNLFLRGGFNFQRRFDMTLITSPYFVGFSCGLGFNYSRFRFDFSRSSYHISGNLNSFSIITNLDKFQL